MAGFLHPCSLSNMFDKPTKKHHSSPHHPGLAACVKPLLQESVTPPAPAAQCTTSSRPCPSRHTTSRCTLDVFFDIADALEVDPADLISASMIPDKMLKGRETRNTAE